MASALIPEIPSPGFSFGNFERNEYLVEKGVKLPKLFSTGTTICGAVFDNGVIFAADKRATAGTTVVEKAADKIHCLTSNVIFCGAGTSGDLAALENLVRAHIELHRLNSGKEVPVCVAVTKICQHLFRYQGHLGCALVLGGVDKYGYHLFHIYPHGSSSPLKFAAMGSGSLAAMSHLELNYKPKMSLEEAKLLVRNAILAGIENDLGSGNCMDLCVITKGKMEYLPNYEIPEAAIPSKKQAVNKFVLGTTPILDSFVKYEEEETVERQIDPDRFMET